MSGVWLVAFRGSHAPKLQAVCSFFSSSQLESVLMIDPVKEVEVRSFP
jgi:hypothetical protein